MSNPKSTLRLNRTAISRREFVQTSAIGALALASGCTFTGGGPDRVKSSPPLGAAQRVFPLDQDWLFGGKFDAAAIAPDFDDTRFTRITLPHTVAHLSWQNWNPADWQDIWIYRRHFTLPNEFQGLRVFLEFDGVMGKATPTLNGRELPAHVGGYLPFRLEITAWLKEGDNVLAVAVDDHWQNFPPDGSPRGTDSIDLFEPGGIIRGARLIATPAIFIADVFAKPVKVLAADRRVEIACTLDAAAAAAQPVKLRTELRDGDRVVAHTEQVLSITQPGSIETKLELTDLRDLKLWDVETPQLYQVVTTLESPGQLPHVHRTRIGFRDARFKEDGFYLNGRRLQLFGLNRHELFPYVGFAMPARTQRRDAYILRCEFNCNVVRCSHYPQSPAFLDACDELGLLVWEELPGWHYIGNEEWQAVAVRNVQEMVRRDRNRPSIILWGVRINESANDVALYQRTTAAARALDDSRAISGAMDGSHYSTKDWAEDVFAYNDYYHPGPSGEVQLRPPLPGQPYLLTEAVGQIVGPGPGSTHKYRRAGDPEVQRRQAIYHAQAHDQAASDPRFTGVIAWCGFDYGSPSNSFSGVKCPGVADIFRIPKIGASFYQAQIDPKVRVVIQPNFYWDFGLETPRGPGRHVAIFSNCERLEVLLDGRPYASLQPDSVKFPHLKYPPFFVDLDLDGSDHPELRVDGYVGDRRVLSRSFSSDPAFDQFVVAVDDPSLIADGIDSTRLSFKVADRFGNERPYVKGEVSLRLEGPGIVVGDNPFSLEVSGGVGAFWIKTVPNKSGRIVVTASHSALGSKSITIGAQAAVSPATE